MTNRLNMNCDDLTPMARQYIVTALWSTNDESTPDGGVPMDANYTGHDLEPESLARMSADCEKFLALVAKEMPFVAEQADETDLGHDLWLTRAGHGAGFFDGDYHWLDRDGIDVGDKLMELCERFPARSLYVGDTGSLHETSA